MNPDRAYGLGEVYALLERSDWLGWKLESQDGFYALKGEGIANLVAQRQERFLDAEGKFTALKRAAKYFFLLPAVRSVSASNTLAWWSTTKDSDIDLYVVTRPGHIWSSRFWLVVPFLLLGRRPSNRYAIIVKNSFCFSFFSTNEALNMEALCLQRDYYMAFWIRSLVPIFDRDGSLATLQSENRWATRVIPNAHHRVSHHRLAPRRIPSLPVQWRVTEPIFRFVQRNRFPANLRDIANLDSRVIVTDDILKFHDNDRRAQYRDQFELDLARHV